MAIPIRYFALPYTNVIVITVELKWNADQVKWVPFKLIIVFKFDPLNYSIVCLFRYGAYVATVPKGGSFNSACERSVTQFDINTL